MSNPSAETSDQLKASTELAPAASSAPAPKTNPPRAAKTTAPKVTSKATVKQPKKAKETPNREPTDVAVETLGNQEEGEDNEEAIVVLKEDPRLAKDRAADMILSKALKAQEEGTEEKADRLLAMWDKIAGKTEAKGGSREAHDSSKEPNQIIPLKRPAQDQIDTQTSNPNAEKGKASLPQKPQTTSANNPQAARPARGGYKGNQYNPNYVDPRQNRNPGAAGEGQGQLVKYR
ncbi:hypothetical protein PtB15_4B165 [Puccinia triticina]|nr:hypothetical protein PtB15_4B165 [Puccinia triticina]